MTAKVLKRSRAKFVSKQIVDQVGVSLQALPEKTPDTLSLRQTIERLREPIEAALAKGYSYDELVPMLAQQGINIQPSTLKRYVLSGGDRSTRRRSTGKTTRQSRKSRGEEAETAEALEDLPIDLTEPSDSEEELEAPAPRKRGRAAAKATSDSTETSDSQPKANGRSRRTTAASSVSRAKSRSSSTRGSRKTRG